MACTDGADGAIVQLRRSAVQLKALFRHVSVFQGSVLLAVRAGPPFDRIAFILCDHDQDSNIARKN